MTSDLFHPGLRRVDGDDDDIESDDVEVMTALRVVGPCVGVGRDLVCHKISRLPRVHCACNTCVCPCECIKN